MLASDKGICKDLFSQNIHVNAIDTITWTGSTDSVFNKASNWDLNKLPCPTHVIVIPSVGTLPVLTTSNVEIYELIIMSSAGAILEIKGTGSLILNK